MNFHKLNTLVLLAAGILALASCKKEEETETDPSLNGLLSMHLTAYILPDEEVKVTPKGLRHPDGKGIGYSWRVNPGMDKSDTTRLDSGLSPEGNETDGSFTYKFGDSLGTYTISCTAFAKGYSNSYSTDYVTIVQPGIGGSITGTGIQAYDVKIPETEYYYIEHDGLYWMRNNLADTEYGAPFENAEAMSGVFGRYYSYEEAMRACPEGWRLPTDNEWRALAKSINNTAVEAYQTIPSIASSLMANAKFNSLTMWSYWPAVGGITNSSSLAVIPCGYANLGEASADGYPMASFNGLYEYAIFWTADMVANETGMAYYRYLICDQPGMYIGKGDMKTFGANVRCVKEITSSL